MWVLIYELLFTAAFIAVSIVGFRTASKLTKEEAKVRELEREKAQLQRELNSSKSEEQRVKHEIITIKDKAKLEEIVAERLKERQTVASVQPTSSSMPAFNRKKTGRSTFNVTTGSNSARSTASQPSHYDPILYSTLDTTNDDSHRHSHSHHHHDSGSSHSSSHDSGSSYSHDSGSSSSYDSGGGGSFD